MCWHTVTLRLNTKLFFCPSLAPWKRRREVNLRRCSCLPWLLWIGRFLKLSECFTAPCLCRDSVKVHTCEESGATDGLATELSRSNPPGPRLLLVTFLHPLSSFFLRSSPHSSRLLCVRPPTLQSVSHRDGTDTEGDCSVGLGSPVLLIYKTLGVASRHRKRYLDDKRLVPFYNVLLISTAARGRHLWMKQKKRGFLII